MNYLTLDIGGSSIKYGVINDRRQFIDKGQMAAPINNIEQFVDSIYNLYKKYESQIVGIGISMPGVIDSKTGFAKTGGAFTYIKDINIVDILHQYISLPITIGNDAKCAANAEIGFGCLKDKKDAVVIVLGTGIGGCLVIDGQVHTGKSFSSGEFSCIRTRGRCCQPINDEWSQVNGMEGLSNSMKKAMHTDRLYTGIEIFEMANQNHSQGQQAIDNFCNQLACQIFNLQFMFDPETIAIGGGISKQPLLLKYLNKYINQMYKYYEELNYPLTKPNVVICTYGNDANLIGAYYQLINTL